jgi:LCP family protein required for cell wall assembly
MNQRARNRNIKRSRRMRYLQYALVVLLIGGLVAGIVGFKRISAWAQWHYATWTFRETREPAPVDDLETWNGPNEPLNFVVIGIDKGSNPGEGGWCRSDVLMFVSVDFKNKRVALVSIPRDTKVTIDGKVDKINSAHSYHGPPGAIEAVRNLLGVSEIHHYVEVDFEAFKGIVDAIGGVPVHMDYEIRDPKVGCLGAGDIWLTGKDALVLCRSRNLPDGDMDRIKNQQKFLTAMATQASGAVKDIPDIQRVLDAVIPYLTTDMAGGDMLNLAKSIRGIKIEDIQMTTIPGHDQAPTKAGQAWFFVHDPVGTAAIMDNVKQYCMITAPAEDASVEQVALDNPSDLPLVVLNGSGMQGAAGKVAEVLSAKGYAPATGTAANVCERTTVYVSPGYSSIASQVVRDFWGLKNPPVQVDEELTGAQHAKVVLVVGRDYTGS